MPAMRFQFTQTTLTELEQALGRIERAIYTPLAELSITAWMSKEPLPFDRRKEGTERSLRKGDAWGGLLTVPGSILPGPSRSKPPGRMSF
jgi:hypothetical protein